MSFFATALKKNRGVDGTHRESFETSEWNFTAHGKTTKFIVVYRPPYSEAHPVTPSAFFREFALYLENVVLCTEILVIAGDFNFHMDDPSDADAKKLNDLLETFSLSQHLTFATHVSGHWLDLIITRATNIMVCSPRPSLLKMDKQEVTLLILLDLSAAFDTIDHGTMLQILENDFGITDTALCWLSSFLVSRKQRVLVNGRQSRDFAVNIGVPQGSCLGPILFIMYASRLFVWLKVTFRMCMDMPTIHSYICLFNLDFPCHKTMLYKLWKLAFLMLGVG